jgi:antitoxin MazE
MESVIRKWGNSPAVRLPKSILKESGCSLEQPVKLTASRGRIVIEPLGQVEYNLADLVAGITKTNRHDEADFGTPVGKETL